MYNNIIHRAAREWHLGFLTQFHKKNRAVVVWLKKKGKNMYISSLPSYICIFWQISRWKTDTTQYYDGVYYTLLKPGKIIVYLPVHVFLPNIIMLLFSLDNITTIYDDKVNQFYNWKFFLMALPRCCFHATAGAERSLFGRWKSVRLVLHTNIIMYYNGVVKKNEKGGHKSKNKIQILD